MLKKNDIITATITDVTNEGSGVTRYENTVIFTPNTLKGEEVKIRIVKVLKNYMFGKCEEIITPSKARIEPPCSVFKRCGGCALQYAEYNEQLSYKEAWVRDVMERIAKTDATVSPIIGSPDIFRYRNKGQYPLTRDKDGRASCGFFAPRTHSVVPIDDCILQPKIFSQITSFVCSYIDRVKADIYDEKTGKGLFRHIYLRYAESTGEIMLTLIINGKSIPRKKEFVEEITAYFPQIKSIQLNINTKNTNVILGDKTELIWGASIITDTLCGVDIDISPESFYQVNKKGAEIIYKKASELAGLNDGDVFLDLYCGAGTIGLSILAQHPSAKLIGVEIVPEAIENAKLNAKRAKLNNAEFICGDAEVASKELSQKNTKPKVIIVDPPRKGCSEDTLKSIVNMTPEKIVMVSCDPATAARDINILEAMGYKAKTIQPVDLFPHTRHIETVIELIKI